MARPPRHPFARRKSIEVGSNMRASMADFPESAGMSQQEGVVEIAHDGVESHYVEFQRLVRGLVARGFGRSHAEDAVQEAFLRLAERRTELRERRADSVLAWLRTTSYRLAVDAARLDSRVVTIDLDSWSGASVREHEHEPRNNGERAALNAELRANLRGTFERLTSRDQHLLSRWMEGSTATDSGTAVGLSAEASKRALHRARQRWARMLEQSELP